MPGERENKENNACPRACPLYFAAAQAIADRNADYVLANQPTLDAGIAAYFTDHSGDACVSPQESGLFHRLRHVTLVACHCGAFFLGEGELPWLGEEGGT